ncbi:MAG: DUF2922 domain-containing protein [Defluviitaleaceae bacterium]|jgi:hypothetical protein|nr:DUF2922 domain-containing protein [Defluviitaleaceae bacterium]
MKETLQMTFRTSHGKDRVVSIVDPRDGLAASTVNTAASMLINANPFDALTGALVQLLRANRVSVATQMIVTPPAA